MDDFDMHVATKGFVWNTVFVVWVGILPVVGIVALVRWFL